MIRRFERRLLEMNTKRKADARDTDIIYDLTYGRCLMFMSDRVLHCWLVLEGGLVPNVHRIMFMRGPPTYL